ncbi:dTDP-4-amino-4,6-dideoxygalactose transaminase [Alteribacillus persepolensis]|uniref:dTDP-4-amino-4,6-dideoxygalactose transaminase n=1 Tax=Alteribacillus persepolensis TaxID=568899 RepID=A0A1G8IQY4_9BACI|nr:DegT/DnrJ/EryC1/StrS family aminotransferase [Alteribacillus persepolensis]SDI21369.1 dTDP-4-amino-4,6-dideoxygalactose transaminase [Alteribacillus persepolensis]
MIRLSKPIISEDEINAVNHVLRSGVFVQNEHVQRFEQLLKQFIGSDVLAVSSGTAALHVALSALKIKKGDAVFLPSFTFPATANVVELQHARPVLVDVDEDTYNIDPKKLEKSIEEWQGPEIPKAIIVVHQFGAPCNMTKIREIAKKYGLFLIEDAACALGTTWNGQHAGTFGDIGCFSWHPRKSITTGEGGAVAVKDNMLRKRIELLRNHGLEKSEGKVQLTLPGFNYRLTEFQAVLGKEQLKKFNGWLESRRDLAGYYKKYLKDTADVQLPKEVTGHAWQTYMVVLNENISQQAVIGEMRQKQIETNIGSLSVHLLDYYKTKYKYQDSFFPISRKLSEQGLALPMYPGLDKTDIDYVCSSLKEIISKCKK